MLSITRLIIVLITTLRSKGIQEEWSVALRDISFIQI